MSADLLTKESLQQRKGGVWDYVSPSRLGLWLKCPLAFSIRYIEGVVTPTSANQFVGRVVHKALETFYRHRLIGVRLSTAAVTGDLAADWGEMVDEEGVSFKDMAHEDACLNQAVALVSAYLGQLAPDEPRPLAVELAAEAPLVDPTTGENLGLTMVGIMDLVLAEPTGPLIADFKTAARGGQPLEVLHEIQLTSYSYLFRCLSPEPEGALEIRSLIKTKVPRIETHRYARRSPGHFRRLFAVIRAYLDSLDSRQFVFRPGLGCLACEFRESHCRSWNG